MVPILFTVGGVPIYAHGTFFVLGLLCGFAMSPFDPLLGFC